MFQMTLGAVDVSKRDLSSLEMIMWSGAPASLALARKLRSIARVSNSYGMTETVGSVTWCVDADDETMTSTVGWPHPAYDVRIAGEDGADADIGESGEIQVKGDFVMSGYWRRAEASREAFTPDGWLKTGDLAQCRKDGAYQLVGRLKEMFKSGGYNVYPREIEMILEELPDVDAAIVVSAPDEIYGEVGVAFVQAKGDAAEVGALERACREKLANYKVPKRFILTDEFPALANGKIDKAALRAIAAKSAAGE
jgi:fatty-acyl-CoA synthase